MEETATTIGVLVFVVTCLVGVAKWLSKRWDDTIGKVEAIRKEQLDEAKAAKAKAEADHAAELVEVKRQHDERIKEERKSITGQLTEIENSRTKARNELITEQAKGHEQIMQLTRDLVGTLGTRIEDLAKQLADLDQSLQSLKPLEVSVDKLAERVAKAEAHISKLEKSQPKNTK